MTGYNTHIVTMRTRRWNDRRLPGDGLRLLICRYRPRGVRKEEETWDEWDPNPGRAGSSTPTPTASGGARIDWQEYKERYLREMKQVPRIQALAERVRGETITLLCSSACEDDDRCHGSLLRALVEEAVGR